MAEVVATLGLLLLIFGTVRSGRKSGVPLAVGSYITGADYLTSFANPAVAIARALSESFAGIEPASVPRFVAAQLVGTAIAVVLIRWMFAVSTPADPH